MKVLGSFVVLIVAGVALGDPARKPAFQRQTAAAPAKPEPESEPAPYQASGWKPAGPQFQYGPPKPEIPAEPTTTETPETTTTPPESSPAPARLQQQQEEPVSGKYYVLLEDGRLQQVVFTAEPAQAAARLRGQSGPARSQLNARPARIQQQQQAVQEPVSGVYYILLEDGRLQQVAFTAEPVQAQQSARLQNQAPSVPTQQYPSLARIQLQLQDVEPISGPVYAYSPLRRILRQI